jgi:hypothetical protein
VRSHLRIWIALMFLAVGLAALVDRLAPSAHVVDHVRVWWPLALVALGVGGGLRLALATRTALRGPAFLTLAGLLALLVTTDPLPTSVRPLLWPTLLVAAGVAMLVRLAVGKPVRNDGPVVSRLVSVAESRHIVWPVGEFSLGTLTAVASGCVIDLREAKPLDNAARIDVTAVFGGIEILVPAGWRVEYERFGRDVEAPEPDTDPRPVLQVKAVTFLASVDVRVSQPADPEGPAPSPGA